MWFQTYLEGKYICTVVEIKIIIFLKSSTEDSIRVIR